MITNKILLTTYPHHKSRNIGDNLISNSHKKILTGDVQEGLNFLGDLDLLMEKLRRRI